MSSSLYFLLLALSCIVIEGFFSMFEMAILSFNKVRLAYFVAKKKPSAILLNHLLQKPSRLFVTTLIIVNTVLQIGSEAARRFYESLHLSVDYAPFTQAILVVIFAELSPLFAARRYPETIALFNVKIVYAVSIVLTPVTWLVDTVIKKIYKLFHQSGVQSFFLTKEEIQRALEEKSQKKIDHFNITIENIFSLKNHLAKEIMLPLSSMHMVPSNFDLIQTKRYLKDSHLSSVLIYHHNMHNIVSVASIEDLLTIAPQKRVVDYAKSPWFVTEDISVLDILKQFRHNNQKVAVVLDSYGRAIGLITLNMIIDLLFGSPPVEYVKKQQAVKRTYFIEKTLSGEMSIKAFNKKYKAALPLKYKDLSDLVSSMLGHPPSEGDIVHIENYEFIVKEPTLLGTKTVVVRTLS